MKISFDCCANTFSNLDVDNDVVSIDSQMNSMDDDDDDNDDDDDDDDGDDGDDD